MWNTWGAVTGVMFGTVLWYVVPDKPFMTVHDMHVIDDQVIVERTIRQPRVVADWQVVIVPDQEENPSCQTVSGPELHEGWSVYEPSEKVERVMHIDIWVGDPGCYDRLEAGLHDMHVTWTPRDERKPVTAKASFTKD